MAINLLLQYPGKVDPVVAAWPYGEPRNITAPGDGLGTPWEAAIVKDIVGLQQSLLKSSAIVPSGTPDEVGTSEYLQALVALVSGRAFTYNDSGVVNTYVLDARTNQQGPANYFDGLIVRFTPGNTNTGVSTANVAGLGVKTIFKPDGASALTGGELQAGTEYELKYNGTNLVINNGFITGEFTTGSIAINTQVQQDIVHGLGTDEIDFGYVIFGNDAGISAGTIPSGRAISTNRHQHFEGILPATVTTPPSIPATNSIRFDLINGPIIAQTLTVKWWARRR